MTQGATIYAFPQVQFVKHIVLTPPINLSYCHPFSSKPTKLLLLSVFECISFSLRLRTCASYLMCVARYCIGICVFVCVRCYVLSCVHTCMCACLCVCMHSLHVRECVCDKHPANGSIRAFKFIRGKKSWRCTDGHSRH